MRGIKNHADWAPRSCEVCGKVFVPKTPGGVVCPGKGDCWRKSATKWHRSPEGRARLRMIGLVGAVAKRARWDEKMLGDLLRAELPQTSEALLVMLKQAYHRGYHAGKRQRERRGACQESITLPDAPQSTSIGDSNGSSDTSRPEGIRAVLDRLYRDQVEYERMLLVKTLDARKDWR